MGSHISWWKLSKEESASICVNSVVVLSSFHQDEDLASKSLRIRISKELVEAVRSLSNPDRQFSNFVVLACGPIDDTNISFTILPGDFTYNTLT